MNPQWWQGEPIWNTLVNQSKAAMTYFWPGSDVLIQGKVCHTIMQVWECLIKYVSSLNIKISKYVIKYEFYYLY